MVSRSTTLKQETLESVVAIAHGRFAGGRSEQAERFIRHYYADIAAEDIVGAELDDLYGAAMSLWQFAAQRRPGEAKIRAFNPRAEKHGWHSPHTVIEIVHNDMPFLVDSVTMALHRRNLTVHLVVHPQFLVERDEAGNSLSARPRGDADANDGAIPESCMHIEIDEQGSPDLLRTIEADLGSVLADVRAAVDGWGPMTDRVKALVEDISKAAPKNLDREESSETVAFLNWLLADNFTFLGYREMDISGTGRKARVRMREDSGIGLLADPSVVVFQGLRQLGFLPAPVQEYLRRPQILVLTKTNWRSTVHRPVQLDAVAVKDFDRQGNLTGVKLFVGLYTSAAYNQGPLDIPILRSKANAVMARSGYDPHSHAGKALNHVLHSYPRDELFQTEEDDLLEIVQGIVQLQERRRVALFLRRDPFERFISAFVYVPRDRYTTRLRMDCERILTGAFNGDVAGRYTRMSDEELSRLHFIIQTKPGAIPQYDAQELEMRLVEAARSWGDRLKQALTEADGEELGLHQFSRFESAFPVAYTEVFSAHVAVYDIGCVDRALETGKLGMNLYHPIEAGPDEFRFKVYRTGSQVALSDILPMLENMGLRVLGENAYGVNPLGDLETVWIHDFALKVRNGNSVDFEALRDPFHESFARIWAGDMENDGFNRLAVTARMGWRQILLLRAYCRYLRQTGITFSQEYMEDTLANNAVIARMLAELFETRFDPDFKGNADALEAGIAKEIRELLENVDSLDEDRIIRRFLNAIHATIRTSFYQTGPGGEPRSYLAMKFDAERLDELPDPRPFREIFVYSPRFEAIHLRFGRVARGGLRWSDRREDFRTEILGLVKAQQVKNAVIVPVGAKGGFVLKQPPPPGDREALQAEGVACYKTFVSSMLDITDNRVGDDIVMPDRVVQRDVPDPYLVVAADKGTATFSDIANGIAEDRGFWLGDAFASGGSAGYDHKKMGITARGAWESVKRHFREIDIDSQTQDFTVVGVGDMSGDVFGNGMLLSRHIRLIGAFNHLHIFVDPNPDPAKSFEERKRLFDLARSNWADYDAKLISKGGGVFERRAKSIEITPQMKKLFDIKLNRLTPAELIHAMLRAECDLLWFGGIGTYVKAAAESHIDAGDRTNDGLRIDARELRCKVVGEGANLGMTQRARIEYAIAGGRLNTDAIDNSAGVDCSDHEVNIKILMADLVARNKISRNQRDKLLEEMTDEVANLVLRDNYQQTQSLSFVHYQGIDRMDEQQRLMRSLERAGRLDRALEFLPDDEVLEERRSDGHPLTRPELSVLLAYAKIVTYDALLASDLPDDPILAGDLARYFPHPIQDKYPDAIERHRLRREIVATGLTNSIVNRTGPAFISEMQLRTGMDAPAIVRAYIISREVFELRGLWDEIESLDNVAPASLQTRMLLQTVRTLWRTTPWFLRNCTHPLDITALVSEFHEGVQRIAASLNELLAPSQRRDTEERAKRYAHTGAPSDLSARIGRLKALSSAPDIVRIAAAAGQQVEDACAAYFLIGDRFRLDWLRRTAGAIPADSHWHRLALGTIIDDMWGHQNELATVALATGKTGVDAVKEWAGARAESVERVEQLLAEIVSAPTTDLAMLAVVNRELRALYG